MSYLLAQFKCQNNFIWHIDRDLAGATIPCESGPRSNGNEYYQNFRTRAFPSDCLVSFLGHPLGVGIEMQSAYSTAQADWALCIVFLLVNFSH